MNDKTKSRVMLLRGGVGKRCYVCRDKMNSLPYNVFVTDIDNEEITRLYHCSQKCYDFTDKTRTAADMVLTMPEFWNLRTLIQQKMIADAREEIAELFGTWFVPREVFKAYKRELYYLRLEQQQSPAQKSDVR